MRSLTLPMPVMKLVSTEVCISGTCLIVPAPVRPMRLKLVGTHQTGAPIHEMASKMAGTFFSVDGYVEFKPVEGTTYQVTGELKKERSCVWIVDAATKNAVTEKVCKG